MIWGFVGKARSGWRGWRIYSRLYDAYQEGIKMSDKPIHQSKTMRGLALAALGVVIGTVAQIVNGEITLSDSIPELLEEVGPIVTWIGAIIGGFGLRKKLGENGGSGK